MQEQMHEQQQQQQQQQTGERTRARMRKRMRKNKQESECASRLQVPDVMERVRPPSTAASGVGCALAGIWPWTSSEDLVAGSCPTMTYHIALTTRTTITTIYVS